MIESLLFCNFFKVFIYIARNLSRVLMVNGNPSRFLGLLRPISDNDVWRLQLLVTNDYLLCIDVQRLSIGKVLFHMRSRCHVGRVLLITSK